MNRQSLFALVVVAITMCPGGSAAGQAAPKPQPRPHGTRIAVEPSRVVVDDGDTVVIKWGPADEESVRILGIDTPETRHLEHDIPYDQPFGLEALAFARGAFAAATDIQLVRASTMDPYGRSLGYLYVNARNYSVMVVNARLAYESVSQFGDNGLPKDAAEVLAAAKLAGPLPFEPPYVFRRRMADVSRFMKANGTYPKQ